MRFWWIWWGGKTAGLHRTAECCGSEVTDDAWWQMDWKNICQTWVWRSRVLAELKSNSSGWLLRFVCFLAKQQHWCRHYLYMKLLKSAIWLQFPPSSIFNSCIITVKVKLSQQRRPFYSKHIIKSKWFLWHIEPLGTLSSCLAMTLTSMEAAEAANTRSLDKAKQRDK